MKEKKHKNCGGIVIWKENPDPKGSWVRAGKCLKCGLFPIDLEDIEVK